MEVTDIGKHSSLLQYGDSYCRKKLYSTGPRGKCLLVTNTLAYCSKLSEKLKNKLAAALVLLVLLKFANVL
jgi:hypothetical protein